MLSNLTVLSQQDQKNYISHAQCAPKLKESERKSANSIDCHLHDRGNS